jgi:hypothetical protein
LWKDFPKVDSFLRYVLSDSSTQVFRAPPWAQYSVPGIACYLDFRNGASGKWIVGHEGWTSWLEDEHDNVWFATHVKAKERAGFVNDSHNHGMELTALRREADAER